jgi:hypothetical protein
MWQYVAGNYKELRKAADDLEQLSIGNRQAYLEKSNGKLTEAQLIEILDGETWLTAEKCLEYGLADEIVAESKDLAAAQQIAQKMNKTFEQQISYNKALVAMKQQMADTSKKPESQKNDPEPPKEPQENKLEKLMAALFR